MTHDDLEKEIVRLMDIYGADAGFLWLGGEQVEGAFSATCRPNEPGISRAAHMPRMFAEKVIPALQRSLVQIVKKQLPPLGPDATLPIEAVLQAVLEGIIPKGAQYVCAIIGAPETPEGQSLAAIVSNVDEKFVGQCLRDLGDQFEQGSFDEAAQAL